MNCPVCDVRCEDSYCLVEHMHEQHGIPESDQRERLVCECGWVEEWELETEWDIGYCKFIDHCHSPNDLYEHLKACLVTKALAGGGNG